MYQKTIWKDHVVEFENRFIETQNADGTIEHEPFPGETIQEGTNQDAYHFNRLENGLMHTNLAFEFYYVITQSQIRELEKRLELAETQLAALTP